MKEAWPGLRIRHSRRAKYVRLVVKPEGVELVVPTGLGENRALAFVDRHRSWLESKTREWAGQLGERPARSRFTSYTTLPWRGRELPLHVAEGKGKKVRIEVDEAVCITVPAGSDTERDTLAGEAFYLWARRWLRGEAERLVDCHASRFGLHPRLLRIKRMKTRWGSCGPRNDINLNWLLALAPESVLEYVVVHELCHIRERNHSERFWALVAEHLPHWEKERRWLKTQGVGLLRRFL